MTVATPLPLVTALEELSDVLAQTPVVDADTEKVTVSPDTGVLPFKTVAVTVEVDVTAAGIVEGVAVTVTDEVLTRLVWSICPEPLWPVADSTAAIVQKPDVALAVYVITTWPLEFVVYGAAGLSVPQAPAGVAVGVSVTVSPETAVPAGLVTAIVTVEVVEPSAGTSVGLGVTVTVLRAVWVMAGPGAAALWPVSASSAVTVQTPAVVLEV